MQEKLEKTRFFFFGKIIGFPDYYNVHYFLLFSDSEIINTLSLIVWKLGLIDFHENACSEFWEEVSKSMTFKL